ncbi:MAG: molybdate ABC transporter permease subunit [Firmicutes bacterium]|nr:molybdate ABC transporter permease subunit [Bacillota bacterium]
MPVWSTLRISLLIALGATAVAVAAGLPLALALARPRWRGRRAVEILVTLPLALPPTVLGYYLLRLIGRSGPVGWLTQRFFGGTLIFTPVAAVLAAAVVSLPLFVQAARSALEEVPGEVLEAAALDGAGPWDRFRHITLPLAWPGICTGVLLAFLRSLGEFGATLMVAGNIPGRTQTLAMAIYTAVQAGEEALAARLALLLVALAGVALWAGMRWRRPGAGGIAFGSRWL